MATRIKCPECEKTFRKESGLKWHLEGAHGQAQQSATFHQTSEQAQTPANDLEQQVELTKRLLYQLGQQVEKLEQQVNEKPAELETKVEVLAEEQQALKATLAKTLSEQLNPLEHRLNVLDSDQRTLKTQQDVLELKIKRLEPKPFPVCTLGQSRSTCRGSGR